MMLLLEAEYNETTSTGQDPIHCSMPCCVSTGTSKNSISSPVASFLLYSTNVQSLVNVNWTRDPIFLCFAVGFEGYILHKTDFDSIFILYLSQRASGLPSTWSNHLSAWSFRVRVFDPRRSFPRDEVIPLVILEFNVSYVLKKPGFFLVQVGNVGYETR